MAYIHSFCPVGETVVTRTADGIEDMGVEDVGSPVLGDGREGDVESLKKVGDKVGTEVNDDGATVDLEVYADVFTEGISEGIKLTAIGFGTVVENRMGFNEGTAEGVGFGDGIIEVDGAMVGTLVGINEGMVEGVGFGDGGIEADGVIVGILVGFNEEITESAGFADVGIEVVTTVGWRVRTFSWVEQLCWRMQNFSWQVAKGLQH